ncbi:phosphotransferase [Kribbella qitaiheensis]|uniref:Phosphotransferase n=1 Tax=Kribbella qitaiheensis TaxID=1544730 RepID=A0A7G6WUR1_9ACTN|nr:phosphotransferase [Kribbella qitaiheensis]QNE17726.1 phosphotransferase [Kribbella qitaiheensis]
MQSANEFFRQYQELEGLQAEGPIELIGQGMEGAVFDLGGDLVGKTWFNRSAAEVWPLQAFLNELSSQRLSFRTPEIRVVDEVDGRAVSIERKLPGTPLREAVESGLVSRDDALELFVEVVTALGGTSAGSASRALPAAEEQTPFYTPHLPPDLSRNGRLRQDAPSVTSTSSHLPSDASSVTSTSSRLPSDASSGPSWGEALADLVLRRAVASRQLLSEDLTGFDELVEVVVTRLREVVLAKASIVHGDICQPNILVDPALGGAAGGRRAGATAVLDWGFLTTAGDNTFDAATAAGFFDMYGPDAEALDAELLERFEKLGHSRDRMHLYRVAYALITATIYSPTTRDGHYRWCLRNLTTLRHILT